MKIVFLDCATVTKDGDVSLSSLESLGQWIAHDITAPPQTAERLRDAEIAISNKVRIDREIMATCTNLKLVAVAATGTNNVDLNAASEAGIQVCNVSGYSTPSVAQHVFGLLLNLVTNMHRYVAEPQAWAQSPIFTRLDYPVRDLAGMTLGLVGVGSIGTRVGKIGEAFGMNVMAYQRPGSESSRSPWPRLQPNEFFAQSDAVSLHCPLTPETHHFINERTLSSMKPGAYLINTGRGELVNEAALMAALGSGQLAGAGLDVLTPEPPPIDHPLLEFEHPGLLITPHNAWSSRHTRQRLVDLVAANIRQFIETGTASNLVNS